MVPPVFDLELDQGMQSQSQSLPSAGGSAGGDVRGLRPAAVVRDPGTAPFGNVRRTPRAIDPRGSHSLFHPDNSLFLSACGDRAADVLLASGARDSDFPQSDCVCFPQSPSSSSPVSSLYSISFPCPFGARFCSFLSHADGDGHRLVV